MAIAFQFFCGFMTTGECGYKRKGSEEASTGEFKAARPEDAGATKRDDGFLLLDSFVPIQTSNLR
jgi:hypothetical protein